MPIEGDPAGDARGPVLPGVARLRPGVTVAQANDELRDDRRSPRARVSGHQRRRSGDGREPYQESLVGDVRNGAAGAARRRGLRAADRLRERRQPAAGARRGAAPRARACAARSAPDAARLVRQLLTESLVLAPCGGAARAARRVLGRRRAAGPRAGVDSRGSSDVRLDPRVAAFAVVASALRRRAVRHRRRRFRARGRGDRRAQGRRPDRHGAHARAESAGGRRGRAGARAADRRRADAHQLRAAARGRSRVHASAASSSSACRCRRRATTTPAQARFYTQLFERLRENPVTARSALVFPTPFGGGNARGRLHGRRRAAAGARRARRSRRSAR